MLYGEYTGTATLDLLEPVEAEATIDADNNELVFEFIIGGLNESAAAMKISIAPNPVTNQSWFNIFSRTNQKFSVWLTNNKGQQIGNVQNLKIQQGENQFLINEYFPLSKIKNGIYMLQLQSQSQFKNIKLIINN